MPAMYYLGTFWVGFWLIAIFHWFLPIIQKRVYGNNIIVWETSRGDESTYLRSIRMGVFFIFVEYIVPHQNSPFGMIFKGSLSWRVARGYDAVPSSSILECLPATRRCLVSSGKSMDSMDLFWRVHDLEEIKNHNPQTWVYYRFYQITPWFWTVFLFRKNARLFQDKWEYTL